MFDCIHDPASPEHLTDQEREKSRRQPDQEIVELAALGAARTFGPQHSATRGLAQAAETMTRLDLWHARLAIKTLRRDQRLAIAEAVEG